MMRTDWERILRAVRDLRCECEPNAMSVEQRGFPTRKDGMRWGIEAVLAHLLEQGPMSAKRLEKLMRYWQLIPTRKPLQSAGQLGNVLKGIDDGARLAIERARRTLALLARRPASFPLTGHRAGIADEQRNYVRNGIWSLPNSKSRKGDKHH